MQLVFWVTTDCNLRCSYCYEGQTKKKEYMNSKTAICAIDYFLTLYRQTDDSELMVRFHGGEPLLNTDVILAIQEHINASVERNNVFYSITTNGCVFSKKAMHILENCMDEINISIDGMKEINDKYRKDSHGKGSYEQAIRTANHLKNHLDIHSINIRITYNSSTVEHLAESIIHFISLGFTEILPAEDLFDAGWSAEKILTLKEQLNIVKCYISTIKEKLHIGGLEPFHFKKRGLCNGGISNFHICPNGNIYPCTYVVNEDEFCLGNVFQGIDFQRVQKLRLLYSCLNKICLGCTYYDFCPSTRCKLVNWKLTGNCFEPSGVMCAAEQAKLKINNLI